MAKAKSEKQVVPVQEKETPRFKRRLCPNCKGVLKWSTRNGDEDVKECSVCTKPNSAEKMCWTPEEAEAFQEAPELEPDPAKRKRVEARANQRPMNPNT